MQRASPANTKPDVRAQQRIEHGAGRFPDHELLNIRVWNGWNDGNLVERIPRFQSLLKRDTASEGQLDLDMNKPIRTSLPNNPVDAQAREAKPICDLLLRHATDIVVPGDPGLHLRLGGLQIGCACAHGGALTYACIKRKRPKAYPKEDRS